MAAVFVRDYFTETAVFVEQAQQEVDQVWVYDDRTTDPDCLTWLNSLRAPVSVRATPPGGLYAGWRHAIAQASSGAASLTLANSDVLLEPGGLRVLAKALVTAPDDIWVVYPDWRAEPGSLWDGHYQCTKGVWPDGLAGWCFTLRPDLFARGSLPWPPFAGYKWYYGDTDFEHRVRTSGGHCARLEGLPVRHVIAATSRIHKHDTTDYAGLDRRLFELSWGRLPPKSGPR